MSPASLEDSTIPFPPRYWWLKRITAVSVAFVVGVVLLRVAWGWDANRRLVARFDAARARGEPTRVDDFRTPSVEDSENAVYYLNQAAGAISSTVDSPSQTNFSFEDYLPMNAKWHALADQAMAADAGALKLAREMRKHSKADWNIPVDQPLNSISVPGLSRARNLANILGDAALYHHLMGDDAESMEMILDLLHEATVVGQGPTFLGYLAETGLVALAAKQVGIIAPGLPITDDSTAVTEGARPATRSQVHQIISTLLDPQFNGGAARSIQYERLYLRAYFDDFAKDALLLRPAFTLDAARAIDGIDEVIPLLQHEPLLYASPGTKAPGAPARRGRWPTDYLESIAADNPGSGSIYLRILTVQGQSLTVRRAAATSLAARLYQVDHDGNWPPTLDAMVPDYLPYVPVDPFSSEGAPLQYFFTDGRSRPIVVGLGEDGASSVVRSTLLPHHPIFGYPRVQGDIVWDISRFDPAPDPVASSAPSWEDQPQ